ncbi:MAG: hypothetical protein IPM42_07295 [Saprospiraceae bacterium]|nr:hypothetical protein [Saprospiraceae bacterium]
MISFLTSDLWSQKDWTKVKDSDGILILIKDTPGSSIKQFKAITTFKEDILTIVKALQDVESMHVWYDRVKSVKTLQKISDTQAIYLLEYSLPFPFQNRYSTLKGTLSYSDSNKKAKIETAYIPYSEKVADIKNPMITKIRSSWSIEAGQNGVSSVIHEGFMDPEGNVPVWAVNKDVADAPLKSLLALKKILPNYRAKS